MPTHTLHPDDAPVDRGRPARPHHENLGDRMKAYEAQTRTLLPRKTWTLIRLDGRAFHTYTRDLDRPFDAAFAADMDQVAIAVLTEMSGAAFGYVQSDEISILATDFATEDTEPWFGGVVPKLTSLTAAIASVAMNQLRPPAPHGPRALFDSRAFTLSAADEVAAYFIWRQRDAIKNSVAMAAQAHFSPKRLHGLRSGEMRQLLSEEAGVDWADDYPAGFRMGRVVVKQTYTEPVTFTHKRTQRTETVEAVRTRWVAQPASRFTYDPDGWLQRHIPTKPTADAASPIAGSRSA